MSTESGMPLPPLVAVSEGSPGAVLCPERQWFLWQLDPHSAAYHAPSAPRLKGRLDPVALQRSLTPWRVTKACAPTWKNRGRACGAGDWRAGQC